MRRKFFLSSVLVTFVFVIPSLAQTPTIEYGQPSELQGVRKVFVDTGMDLESRDRILREIQKGAPNLTVVSRPEDTDIHLRFHMDDEDNYAVIVPAKARIGIASVSRGAGTVVKVVDDKRVRVLWSRKDSKKTFLDSRPSTSFGREFVKLYRRYN
ncbi:MAG TPA: hypothetical protein VN256_08290 [Pyrinomonadaceae bacterium]|nr:hypothetical protein [Pyrinomonadaceae bacterium]